MEPAFSSTRQAAAFALLLLLLLLLPALFDKEALPPREQIYSSVPWRYGPFPYLHQAIFEDKADIDIAFIGSSIMYWGIDTPYVQDALTKDLGRKSSVVTLAWNTTGFDPIYFVAQDLIQNRKVNTIVFVDGTRTATEPNPAAPFWFRFGDNAGALHGMPLACIPQYYFAAILGMPRNLLSLVRSNSSDYLYSTERLSLFHSPHPDFNAENPAHRLGSMAGEIGYNFAPFVDYTPVSRASPTYACIYSSATADKFRISNEPILPLELHFVQAFEALAKSHGVRLILLTLPHIAQRSDPFIQVSAFTPEFLRSEVTMLGIPPAELFAGIASQDIGKLYAHDGVHLNKNGQAYFTKLITPTLLRTYENQAQR